MPGRRGVEELPDERDRLQRKHDAADETQPKNFPGIVDAPRAIPDGVRNDYGPASTFTLNSRSSPIPSPKLELYFDQCSAVGGWRAMRAGRKIRRVPGLNSV